MSKLLTRKIDNSLNILRQILKEYFLVLRNFSNCFYQVLKVAILAEKYAVDYTWYVDTILNLIRIAGDYVSEEVNLIVAVIMCGINSTLRVLLF